MSLNREGLVDGENFEEKGKFGFVLGSDVVAHQSLVVADKIEERASGGEVLGRQRRVGAHP